MSNPEDFQIDLGEFVSPDSIYGQDPTTGGYQTVANTYIPAIRQVAKQTGVPTGPVRIDPSYKMSGDSVEGEYLPTTDLTQLSIGSSEDKVFPSAMAATFAHEQFHAKALAPGATDQIFDDLRANGYSDEDIKANMRSMIDAGTKNMLPSMNSMQAGHEAMATIYADRQMTKAGLKSPYHDAVQATLAQAPLISKWVNSGFIDNAYGNRVMASKAGLLDNAASMVQGIMQDVKSGNGIVESIYNNLVNPKLP